MPATWDEATFNAFYNIPIGWADARDPANINGERIGEYVGYGLDFVRYVERRDSANTVPYWYWIKRAAWLLQHLIGFGLLPIHRVLVVGAGYNYLPYAFRNASAHPGILLDYPLTYGIDNSSYVQSRWNAQAIEGADDTKIVFDDFTDIRLARVRNKLEAMTGGFSTFHVVIGSVTESYQVKDPLTGATIQSELDAFNGMLDACELALVGSDTRRIIHLVDFALFPGQDDRAAELPADDDFTVQREQGMAIMSLAEWAAIRPRHTWLDNKRGDVIIGTNP